MGPTAKFGPGATVQPDEGAVFQPRQRVKRSTPKPGIRPKLETPNCRASEGLGEAPLAPTER
eukprot:6228408-Alexandrium_andersonii.AAC.1